MLSPPKKGVVVALGNFDGVHLGHQKVIQRALEEAHARRLRCVAATFDPHPQAIVGRRRGLQSGSPLLLGPFLLTPLDVKKEILIGEMGVDEVRVIEFDHVLARKSPRSFVLEVLVGEIGAAIVVVGENFRFGYKASGRFSDLDSYMREAGGEAIAVPTLKMRDASTPPHESGIVSSTKIRALLAKGEVREASILLGRPYSLRGRVVAGEGRAGSTLGFPTANVVPIDRRSLVPGRGVYAGRVSVHYGEEERKRCDREYVACTNIGLAPTFAEASRRREGPLVETHLIDFFDEQGREALYGAVLDVTFVERIRAEKRFEGIEELKEQIARDVHEARRVVGKNA